MENAELKLLKDKYSELIQLLKSTALQSKLESKLYEAIKDEHIENEIDFLSFLITKLKLDKDKISWDHKIDSRKKNIDFLYTGSSIKIAFEISTLNLRQATLGELANNREKFTSHKLPCIVTVYIKDTPLRIYNAVNKKLKSGQLLPRPAVNIVVLYDYRGESNFSSLYTAAYGEYRKSDKILIPSGKISAGESLVPSLFNIALDGVSIGGIIVFNGYSKFGILNEAVEGITEKTNSLLKYVNFNYQDNIE